MLTNHPLRRLVDAVTALAVLVLSGLTSLALSDRHPAHPQPDTSTSSRSFAIPEADIPIPAPRGMSGRSTSKTDLPAFSASGPASRAQFPILYAGLRWVSTQKGEIVFAARDGGVVKLAGYHIESELSRTYQHDFFTYYHRELTARDWNRIDFASGPNGEWYSYEQDGQYFTIGIRVVSTPESKLYQAIVEYSD